MILIEIVFAVLLCNRNFFGKEILVCHGDGVSRILYILTTDLNRDQCFSAARRQFTFLEKKPFPTHKNVPMLDSYLIVLII